MSKKYKYLAGFYTGDNKFIVCIKSNSYGDIAVQSEAQNYELRSRQVAIKRGSKRINPEYKVLRLITNQLRIL